MKVNNIKKIAVLGSSVMFGLSLAFIAFAENVQLNSPISATNFKTFLTAIAKGVAGIIGPAAGLMVVVAGVLFVISEGSPDKVNVAKLVIFRYN